MRTMKNAFDLRWFRGTHTRTHTHIYIRTTFTPQIKGKSVRTYHM